MLRDGVERTLTILPRIPPGAIAIYIDDASYAPVEHALTVHPAMTSQLRLVMLPR